MAKSNSITAQLDRIEGMLAKQTDELLNSRQAAEYLHISIHHLWRLTSEGAIPHYKPGGRLLYFRRSELNEWAFRKKVRSTDELRETALNSSSRTRATGRLAREPGGSYMSSLRDARGDITLPACVLITPDLPLLSHGHLKSHNAAAQLVRAGPSSCAIIDQFFVRTTPSCWDNLQETPNQPGTQSSFVGRYNSIYAFAKGLRNPVFTITTLIIIQGESVLHRIKIEIPVDTTEFCSLHRTDLRDWYYTMNNVLIRTLKLGRSKFEISPTEIRGQLELLTGYSTRQFLSPTYEDARHAIDAWSFENGVDLWNAEVIGYEVGTSVPISCAPEEIYPFLGARPRWKRVHTESPTESRLMYETNIERCMLFDSLAYAHSSGLETESLDNRGFEVSLRHSITNGASRKFRNREGRSIMHQPRPLVKDLFEKKLYDKLVRQWHNQYMKIEKLLEPRPVLEPIPSTVSQLQPLILAGFFDKIIQEQDLRAILRAERGRGHLSPDQYKTLSRFLSRHASGGSHFVETACILELDRAVAAVVNRELRPDQDNRAVPSH